MGSTTKDCHLGIRLSCELKEALEQAAVQDDRTISNYVERVLREHMSKVAGRGRRKGRQKP